tara:strand:- start:3155 stop:3412 length:258 start_codon:yes stop_codon:yes gene_type:complete
LNILPFLFIVVFTITIWLLAAEKHFVTAMRRAPERSVAWYIILALIVKIGFLKLNRKGLYRLVKIIREARDLEALNSAEAFVNHR